MSWAKIVRPEDERKVIYGAGDEYSFMATSEDTDGHYFFVEAVVPPGGGPPPHIQTREEEGFYVTEGELVFRAQGERMVAKTGAFVHVPRGVPHHFKNESNANARMVFFFVPGGIEGMFEEMAADPSRFVEIAKEYGVEFVDTA